MLCIVCTQRPCVMFCNAPSTSEQTQTDGLKKHSFVKKRVFNRLRRLRVILKVSYFGFPVCVHCNRGSPVKKVGPFLGVGPKHKNGQVAKKEIFFRQALSINSTHF